MTGLLSRRMAYPLLGVTILLFLMTLIFACGGQTATEEPEPTEPPPATAATGPTPEPSNIPEPTTTPEPTAIREPMAPPTPEPTPTPTIAPTVAPVLTDRDILEVFYHATGGPNWANHYNWLTDRPIGEWYGVTTDAVGRLTELNFFDRTNRKGNGLKGQIPAELGNLAMLTVLNLSSNELQGEIPPELGNLSQLTSLILSGNQLTGEIPSSLGNLSQLTSLLLAINQLSGQIPPDLGSLASLESLWMDRNDLSGPIPPELGQLYNLKHLELAENRLSGEIPASMANLTNLTRFALGDNQFTGSLPSWLGSFSELTHINLRRNRLSGSLPKELGNLAKVQSFYINNNQLAGEIPQEWGNMSRLFAWKINGNSITGCVPAELEGRLRFDIGSTDIAGLPFCEASQGSASAVAIAPAPTATPRVTATPSPSPTFGPTDSARPTATAAPPLKPETGVISTNEQGVIRSRAEFLYLENNVLFFLRGDDVVASTYVEAKVGPGLVLKEKVGGSFRRIAPEAIPTGGIVYLYSGIVDSVEVPHTVILFTPRSGAVLDGRSVVERISELPWFSEFERMSKPKWLSDSLTESEGIVLSLLWKIAPKDFSLFEHFLSAPWLEDGVKASEMQAIIYLTGLAAGNVLMPDRQYTWMVEHFLEQPWVADGVTEREGRAVRILGKLALDYPPLTEGVLRFSWAADDLSQASNEQRALKHIRNLAEKDLSRAVQLVSLPWLADGITNHERFTIAFAQALPEIENEWAETAWGYISENREITKAAGLGLYDIHRFDGYNNRNQLELLLNQPWLQDGLSDNEAALILVVRRLAGSPKVFQEYIDNPYVISDTFSLPLAGETSVFAISRKRFDRENEVLRDMRKGVEAMEELFGEPWPVSNVVVLVEPEVGDPESVNPKSGIFPLGFHASTHIHIKAFGGGLYYHELAHYLFRGMGAWMNEGAAEFFESYALSVSEEPLRFSISESKANMNRSVRNCAAHGATNIHKWKQIKRNARSEGVTLPRDLNWCDYALGEAFLWGMYDSLGQDTVVTSLLDLVRLRGDFRIDFEEAIYETFLNNAPVEKRDEFRALYSRLHGGPIPEN